MTAATLGPAIGRGYVPGLGAGIVFDSDKPNFFTIQTTNGHRYWVARERIQFRK